MAIKYAQTNTLYLSGSGVIIGATSIVLTTFTDIYGNVLTMTDFGTKGYGTLEPDTTNEEAFTFTGVVANANGTYTLTGVSTALARSPYTETSGLVRSHSGGTKCVISDNVAFWNGFANLNNTNTFTILPQSAATPTVNADFATKVYADGLAIAGAPNSTTGVKGILQLSTQAQLLSKTATGSTGAALAVTPDILPSTLLSDYKVDTGVANAYVITPAPAITAYTTGQIFSFKAVNANTTASTLNVNGLGVKTIKRQTGGDLLANDILAGQIVLVEYDGTNFQFLSNITLPAASQNQFLTSTDGTNLSMGRPFDYQSFTVNGTWTKPANLSGNEAVLIRMWGGGGGGGNGVAANQSGGGGGGGGFIDYWGRASDFTATVAVTVAVASVAAAAGGSTTFGAYATAFGGGGGGGGGANYGSGGGGGGIFSVGGNGAAGNSALGGNGGGPLGGLSSITVDGIDGNFGGAAGAGITAGGASLNAANSMYGGGGGGAGNANGVAATGGGKSFYGGGGGGSRGNSVNQPGGTSVYGGAGGAGGATGTTGTAPGGGGGGGATAGAAGARGECRVYTFL